MKKLFRIVSLFMICTILITSFSIENVYATGTNSEDSNVLEENRFEQQTGESTIESENTVENEDIVESANTVESENTVENEDTANNLENDESKSNLSSTHGKENTLKLKKIYINQAEQAVGEQQNIIVALEDNNIKQLELLVENENGEQIKLSQIKNIDNVYLFQNNFERGTYHISGVYAFYDGQSCYFSAKDLEINAYFSVGKVCEEQKSKHIEMQSAIENENSEDAIETPVITIDENGDTSTQDSIAEAMEEIGVEKQQTKSKGLTNKRMEF